jgi:hypothetical protein
MICTHYAYMVILEVQDTSHAGRAPDSINGRRTVEFRALGTRYL